MTKPITLTLSSPKRVQTEMTLLPVGLFCNPRLQNAKVGDKLEFWGQWKHDKRKIKQICKLKVNSPEFTTFLRLIYGDNAKVEDLYHNWRMSCIAEGLNPDAFDKEYAMLVEVKSAKKTMTYQKQVIYGDIPSKSNGYKVITLHGHGSIAKSKALKEYEQKFFLQCSLRNQNISSFFKITIDAYFGSNRKDLDGCFKILLDCLQSCKAIKNDRLCTEIVARKLVDKETPRVEFTIEEIIL